MKVLELGASLTPPTFTVNQHAHSHLEHTGSSNIPAIYRRDILEARIKYEPPPQPPRKRRRSASEREVKGQVCGQEGNKPGPFSTLPFHSCCSRNLFLLPLSPLFPRLSRRPTKNARRFCNSRAVSFMRQLLTLGLLSLYRLDHSLVKASLDYSSQIRRRNLTRSKSSRYNTPIIPRRSEAEPSP